MLPNKEWEGGESEALLAVCNGWFIVGSLMLKQVIAEGQCFLDVQFYSGVGEHIINYFLLQLQSSTNAGQVKQNYFLSVYVCT